MSATKVKCIYVFCGSDAFLRDEHRRSIVLQVIADADPQIAVSRFDATAELAEVLDTLRTLPFLAPRRAVVISDADAFVSAYRQALEKYLQSPSESSTLILMVSSWPKNTRLAKRVAEIGEVMDCSVGDERKAATWLRKAAAQRNKTIDPGAIALLLQWRGTDLATLSGEIEKLTLYVGDRASIDAEDVSKLVVATTGPEAFALTNALAAGETAAALQALAGAVRRRGEEYKTLGMIGWHMRKALKVRQLLDAGVSDAQACRRPMKMLRKDFRRLLATDLAVKTGAEASIALQQLVASLCNG